MRNVISVVRKFMVGASLLGLAVLAFSANPALGQATTGNLTGEIKDATGAAVPNASIVLTNEVTGVSVTGTSNSSGNYLFQNLQPAAYDLKVTAPSFAPYLAKGVHVELNSTATANVPLSIGSQSTTVEVQSDASAALDTTTTNLATTFSNIGDVGLSDNLRRTGCPQRFAPEPRCSFHRWYRHRRWPLGRWSASP